MSPQFEIVEDIVPVDEPQVLVGTEPSSGRRHLKTSLRMLASLTLAPLLLFVAVLGFVAVLADFAWFRLADHRAGHPEPKGLWEF